jgi:hypothetical protein
MTNLKPRLEKLWIDALAGTLWVVEGRLLSRETASLFVNAMMTVVFTVQSGRYNENCFN